MLKSKENMRKLLAKKDNIVVQKLDDETLVYDRKENKAFCLNETSALVWELIRFSNSLSKSNCIWRHFDQLIISNKFKCFLEI